MEAVSRRISSFNTEDFKQFGNTNKDSQNNKNYPKYRDALLSQKFAQKAQQEIPAKVNDWIQRRGIARVINWMLLVCWWMNVF